MRAAGAAEPVRSAGKQQDRRPTSIDAWHSLALQLACSTADRDDLRRILN
jgi:hypothetical protein